MGLWRSATAGVLSVVVAEGREMPPTVLSGCVSLAGRAHDIASAPVVSLLPPCRSFALPFDPEASF
jgi:hypothetical protein